MTHSHECHVSSKYSIKIKAHHHVRKHFPMVCLEGQRMHHHCMCASPHSLHRLYLPVLVLSANLCACHIAYVYSRTPLFGEPPPQAHTKVVLICMQTKQKRLKQNVAMSLHTCLDTCNNSTLQGQRSRDKQANARMCAHVDMEICLPTSHLLTF